MVLLLLLNFDQCELNFISYNFLFIISHLIHAIHYAQFLRSMASFQIDTWPIQ